MITEEAFHGGAARSTSAQLTLTMASARVQTYAATSGATPRITLPDASLHGIVPGRLGGPWFVILNKGSLTPEVRFPIGGGMYTSLGTIPAGTGVGIIDLVDAGENRWVMTLRTRGLSRTRGHGTYLPIVAEEETLPTTPFCFVGDDCEFAAVLPLDSEEGRPEVVVPMFQEVPRLAQNQLREPIRGADVVMPDKILIRISEGEFVKDPAHPLASTNLSPEFWAAFENAGNPHLLAYLGSAHGVSRNPYHVRGTTTDPVPFVWAMPNDGLSVKRHVWEKQVEYGDGFTLRLRFQVEHTVDPEPDVDGEGGTSNAEEGMWGSLFCLYAFTDELSPAFVDGGTHQPAAFAAVNTFTLADPFIWGLADGVSGGSQEDKGAHPQMLFASFLKTTWHDPCLYEWVPLEDRKYIMQVEGGDLHGRNREHGYRRPNCTPWITDPERDEEFCQGCDEWTGIIGISHFGSIDLGGPGAAAMTYGGDVVRSTISEHVCMENGLATGRTYLIPQRAGWDEEIGRPTTTGASVSIRICGVNSDDNEEWPRFELDTCRGHPAEPLEGIGGTHRCFLTGDLEDDEILACCMQLVDDNAPVYYSSARTPMQDSVVDRPAPQSDTAEATDYCTREFVTYGRRLTDYCEIVDFGCETVGRTWTQRVMLLYDYTYSFNGNPLSRQLQWRRYLPDPEQVFFHYTYDDADTADLVEAIGSWTFGPVSVGPSAMNNDKWATALLLYSPAGVANRDTTVSARFLTALTNAHFLCARTSVNEDGELTGYVGIVYSTGADVGKAEIYYIVEDAITTLASADIVLDSDEVDATFSVWGHEITFDYEVDGNEAGQLTALHCAIPDGGLPGCGTNEAATGALFQEPAVVDDSVDTLYIDSYLDSAGAHLDFPPELRMSWGTCTEVYNPDCGSCCEPELCNCTTWAEALVYAQSTTWGGPGDVLGDPAPTDPTYAYGPNWSDCETIFCAGVEPGCDQCPRPFIALTLSLPYRCRDDEDEDIIEPNICMGISKWFTLEIFCE